MGIAKGLQQSKSCNELQKVLHSPSFLVFAVTDKIQFLPSGDRNRTGILIRAVCN
ncbi:MAG: hypothetical protein PUP90_15350 [Nostoc sp. S4]|nr:hypothetical protein [Nostoc sp. S4]